MIQITLPDGTQTHDAPVRGAEIAARSGDATADKALAIRTDGVLRDLNDLIEHDGRVEVVTRDHPEALELLRHDAAHVLAEAVKELYPDAQVTIGPTIENGFYYDFARETSFTPEDLVRIEERMREIVARDEPIERELWARDDAIRYFEAKGERYKAEIIAGIPATETLSVYRQGEFRDLCRGPHLTSTGKLGTAFKLLKVAGAYWRGDHRNPMLQRIYGTAWRDQAELDAHLHQLEEAEKRDHRKLSRDMDLFHFQEEAPGAVFWHPKGWTLFQTLIDYMRQRQARAGYVEINTPDIMDRSLWEQSGHWEKFGENMFTTEAKEKRVFALKPMNCPGGVQVYKQGIKSYRDLPLRIAEFGKVHRFEPSGALHGLMRVRAFTQDDAHIFCTEEQITQECRIVCQLILNIYRDFGFEDVRIKFSDRPAKRIGSDAIWTRSEAALKAAVDATGLSYTTNPGEGAFYGPKLEFVLRDAIGRDWQCGTLQVDLNLPERLGAFYIGPDGEKHSPVMLHRALFGSLERFTGILLEHYAGKLPLWLAPVQAVVATITSDGDSYASEVAGLLMAQGLRVETDLRNEKIGYKIREHSLAKVPVLLVVGKREAKEGTVSLRRIGRNDNETLTLREATVRLETEALRSTLAPVSFPNEGPSEDKERLTEAVAG
ncbi:MAG: threonine--tRNA ligase [Proteobacteria bacterium]|nr:threonine--tRNA ligase [Alphaproteobacteria bacterium]MDA0785852.1 threonine--tRNA ligase [Pseudomonadota bacterium]